MTKRPARPARPVELRPDLAKLPAYNAPQADAPVKLNTNESPWGPPESLLGEVADRLRAMGLNRYPDRDAGALRAAIGAWTKWPAEGVWVANGSNEILLTLLLAFGGPTRSMLLFEPTYAMHAHIGHITGTKVVRRRLDEPWLLDPTAVAKVVGELQPDLVFICSPNNPTGNAQPIDAVEAALASGSGLVVCDEAYGEFGGESAMGLAAHHDRVVVVRSFSKSWRLAGARLGYLLAHPWLVEALQVARLPYHLSAVSQVIGEVAMKQSPAALSHVGDILLERARLAQELAHVPGVEVFPSDANFLLFRTPQDATRIWQALADDGILIRDFSAVKGLERCLRVTVGTGEQNALFVETLRSVLSDAPEA